MKRNVFFNYMHHKAGAPDIKTIRGNKVYSWFDVWEGQIRLVSYNRDKRVVTFTKVLSDEYPVVCLMEDLNIVRTKSDYKLTIGELIIC